MKNIFNTLKDTPLFSNIAFSDFEKILACLSAKKIHYKKNDIILLSGNKPSFVGLVLSGNVQIIKEDFDGNISILAELSTSEVFGEAFACAGIEHSPVTVKATSECDILMIDYHRIITTCPSGCEFHTTLIENMLKLIAHKNMQLNQKINILSKRSTREKLLCFFDMERGSSNKFTIPFNREELAQYICVDRSAMSAELSRMKKDGIIDINKNEVEIL